MAEVPSSASRRALGPIVLVSLLMAVYGTAPYARATLAPPPGTAFNGYFWYVDDAFNYLSYVQQAEDGAFLFRNRLVLEPHDGSLVNLEWWLVGLLSRVLGREPLVAYRLLALGAIVGLVAGVRFWLRDAGLPETHAAAALLLVCLGGGGAALCSAQPVNPLSCLDVRAGLFPFLEILANPHFVVGTALLLWALRSAGQALDQGGWRRAAVAALLASALSVTRPYDFVLLVAIRTIVVLLSPSARRLVRHAVFGALLLPAVAYNAWAFYGTTAFRSFQSFAYVFPTRVDFAWALGPGAAVAFAAWAAGRWRSASAPPDAPQREAIRQLTAWLAIGAVLVVTHPVNFTLQFVVGIGVPLLGLAALGLAHWRPAATWLVAALLSTAAVYALHITLAPAAPWYVPAERIEAARALRAACRPGDIVVAPPDIGLYAGGYSSCTAYVSHAAAVGFDERAADLRAFYQAGDPGRGAAFLDRVCAAHVVVPAATPIDAFVGPSSFQPSVVAGPPGRAIAVYSRAAPASCAPAR
jgi:hypothetical protein